MSEIIFACEVCRQEYPAGKEHTGPKHCKECAEWLRALDMGPYQGGGKDYRKLGMVIAHLLKSGKLGEENYFVSGFVNGIRK